jgi:hypothetical protein
MARGWESKSVEEQVEQQTQDQQPAAAASSEPPSAEQRAAKAARERTRQALELQRERILSERTSSPIRRAALAAALADIETRLTQI